MAVININYGLVLLAGIAGFVLGILWFMPFLFGNAWKKMHKFSKRDVKGPMWRKMLLGFIGTLVTSWVIAIILESWGVTTMGGAIVCSLLIWLGFVAATNLDWVLWGKEPEGAYIINALYRAVQFVVMGVILTI